MKKAALITLLAILILAVCACGAASDEIGTQPIVTPSAALTSSSTPPSQLTQSSLPPIITTSPEETVVSDTALKEDDAQTTPEPSPTSGTTEDEPGTVRVYPGDTLNSKIVPRISDAFNMSESDVKDILENCRESKLINPELSDFRRMEGIIIPGTYDIGENEKLEDTVDMWIHQAEARYDAMAAACSDPNDLKPYEALSLAAVVEAECLSNNKYEEVAAALLNRLNRGQGLQCCVTVEYAVGYMRPYTTTSDTKVKSQYNTYYIKGVPIGPICALEDDCLRVSVAESTDESLYYFFNDYARREMLVFSDYSDFKAAGAISRELYDQTFDIDPYQKLGNKKEVFGYPQ